MLAEEVLAAWLSAGECGVAVGSPESLTILEQQAAARGLRLVRLNHAVLSHLSDPDSLAATEVGLAGADAGAEPSPGRTVEPRTRIRGALQTAYAAWLEQLRGEAEPLVVTDLELALAEGLELGELATLERPVLVLVPGELRDGKVRCHATLEREGELLPPAVTRSVWEIQQQDSPRSTA